MFNILDLTGTDKIDILNALFGWEASSNDQNISRVIVPSGVTKRDHVWEKNKNTNVSAVLIFNELQHSNINSADFCIYENPWAKYTPPVSLRCLPHGIVKGDYLEWYQGESLGNVLNLLQNWPGPK
ncbi:MAG: hypothetical protein JW712_09020 [Dehalococcoidales bacterium]|nr:hypothetical protein [Dehalococcoidales bacterium]